MIDLSKALQLLCSCNKNNNNQTVEVLTRQ